MLCINFRKADTLHIKLNMKNNTNVFIMEKAVLDCQVHKKENDFLIAQQAK